MYAGRRTGQSQQTGEPHSSRLSPSGLSDRLKGQFLKRYRNLLMPSKPESTQLQFKSSRDHAKPSQQL